MPLRLRKTFRIGFRRLHVKLNVTQGGFSSWSLQVGPWSWNSRSRRQRVDLPGPWHYETRGRR